MRNVAMSVGVGLALTAGSAVAGPPVERHIDPDAKWVMHLDLDAVDSTKIGDFLMEMIVDEADDFEEIQEIIPGFWPGPEAGIFGFTVYGTSLDVEGGDGAKDVCAIIYGNDQIAGWGRRIEQVAEHEGIEDKIKTREIHGCDVWSIPMDDGGRVYVGKVQKRGKVAWVFSFDSNRIERSLEIISEGGKTELLPRDGWRDGTIAYFSTSTLDGLDIDDHASRVIGGAKSVRVRIGEADGEAYLQAALDTGDTEHADKIRNIAQGLLAIGQLMAGEDEELAVVMEVARDLEIDTSGSTVLFGLTHDADDVIGFLEEAIEADVGDIKVNLGDDEDDDEAW